MEGKNIELTLLNVQELKALAFDFVVERDRVANNLSLINQEIKKREFSGETFDKAVIKEEK